MKYKNKLSNAIVASKTPPLKWWRLLMLGCALLSLPACQAPVQRLNNLDGLAEPLVIHSFGEPTQRREYAMSEAPPKSAARLQRYHPLPENGDVRIRELTWGKSRYMLTIWLHKTNDTWTAFDSVRHRKEAEFDSP